MIESLKGGTNFRDFIGRISSHVEVTYFYFDREKSRTKGNFVACLSPKKVQIFISCLLKLTSMGFRLWSVTSFSLIVWWGCGPLRNPLLDKPRLAALWWPLHSTRGVCKRIERCRLFLVFFCFHSCIIMLNTRIQLCYLTFYFKI